MPYIDKHGENGLYTDRQIRRQVAGYFNLCKFITEDKQYVDFVLLLDINSHCASFDAVDNSNEDDCHYYELKSSCGQNKPLLYP